MLPVKNDGWVQHASTPTKGRFGGGRTSANLKEDGTIIIEEKKISYKWWKTFTTRIGIWIRFRLDADWTWLIRSTVDGFTRWRLLTQWPTSGFSHKWQWLISVKPRLHCPLLVNHQKVKWSLKSLFAPVICIDLVNSFQDGDNWNCACLLALEL